ncbi:MAG: hypothetical protein HDS16_05495 [Bacteroides sp.]|nr:hypothetical protein [Bacteroides sp.]
MKQITYTLKRNNSKRVFDLNIDAFRVDELQMCFSKLKKYILRAPYSVSKDSDPAIKRNFENALGSAPNVLRKPDWVALITSFYSEPANMFELIRAVAPKFLDLWKNLLKGKQISMEAAETAVDAVFLLMDGGQYWKPQYIVHPLLMGVSILSDSYYLSSGTPKEFLDLYLSGRTMKDVADYIMPNALKAIVVDTLPSGWKAENFENETLLELPILNTYASTNQLTTMSNSVTYSKVKGLANKLELKEFNDYEQRTPLSRKRLLTFAFISLVAHNYGSGPLGFYSTASSAEFARYVATELMREPGTAMFRVMLPYYEGITKKYAVDSKSSSVTRKVSGLLKAADDGWLDMQNFRFRFLADTLDENPDLNIPMLFGRWSKIDYEMSRSDVEVPPLSADMPYPRVRLLEDLTWPFVIAYIRLLQAVGIIEIAWSHERKKKKISQEQALSSSYVRLTPLGRFAFGLTSTYEAKANYNTEDDIDIDSTNMIITVLNQNSPARIIVESTGHPIGGNRYLYSAQKLVASSSSKIECFRRINNLREFIKPKSGDVWDKLLKECELRMNSELPLNQRYSLISLNIAVPGLVNYIKNSAEIRANVIYAEGARLLVPVTYLDTLRKLLLKEGYMID